MKHLWARGVWLLGWLLVLWHGLPGGPGAHAAERVVVSAGDSGPGTLRAALFQAAPGDTITFSPAAFPPGSPVTIWVRSALPALDQDGVTLDASQAGVILNGAQAPDGTKGLVVEADNCTIRGLIIRDFKSDGLYIAAGVSGTMVGGDRAVGAGPVGQGNQFVYNGASGIAINGDDNVIQGNLVGTDGNWHAGNGSNGVSLWGGASSNTIGGVSDGLCHGACNVISGNGFNGIWIAEPGTDGNVVIGNYIGARANGLEPVSNGASGISVQNGPQGTRIGGSAAGEGNLISGNADNGLYISDANTGHTQVLGNLIGPDRTGAGILGQGGHGVMILLGASDNEIGDSTLAGRNLISGNSWAGVRIEGADTANNQVRGNYIGTNSAGTAALPNGTHAVELLNQAHHNQIGGSRLLGEGNLMSGNAGHGLVITTFAHDNVARGNLIGPDVTGALSLGNHPQGGIDISNGAHHNVIGGLAAGEGNVVSGNATDGICVFKSDAHAPADNELLGNLVGVALDGSSPLPNDGFGILITDWVLRTRIERNVVAFNESYGLLVATCGGHTITRNSIYGNGLSGIFDASHCVPAPLLALVTLGSSDSISGTAAPNARVEFFGDDLDEGRHYEGWARADAAGSFVFSKPGGFAGPNVTATSTDAEGNTSAFSAPVHLEWTVLLYLNGDNDLGEFMVDTLTNTVAAGPSPRANVLAVLDGYTTTAAFSPTVVYDLTGGQAVALDVSWNLTGELNMGDAQALVDFVTWGQAYYPARHTLLAIVDHGGGWAPSSEGLPGAMPIKGRYAWHAGNSGLSWDFSSDMDYLGSQEMRQAMAALTADGTRPIDVLFYDVCLMGMAEVAYQVQDYASFLVSSQNVAWAPLGPEGRYVRLIQGLPVQATPREMAEYVVGSYAASLPADAHPFTIAALDLAYMPQVATTAGALAAAINQSLAEPGQVLALRAAYQQAQKLDYDADLYLEPETDGFVDLYDLAGQVTQQFTTGQVVAAAQAVMTTLDAAIVAEAHQSGSPWVYPERTWDLDQVHGLSIFLPLGEDRVITTTFPITVTPPYTHGVRLRDLYTCQQLEFVCDTAWKEMIDTYYTLAPAPVITSSGPVGGLLPTDVTPPQTEVVLGGEVWWGGTVSLAWAASDGESGVRGGALWHRPPHGEWRSVVTRTGTSGVFSIVLSQACDNVYAVRAIDHAGNVEPLVGAANHLALDVPPCRRLYLPLISR